MELPYVRSSSNVPSKRIRQSDSSMNGIVAQRPTDFLCRLIRKAYSTDEIIAGITPDERLERIKGEI